MSGVGFLEQMGIIAVCAALLVALGRAVRMPAIVVYLLGGVLLGPVFGWVEMGEGLELVSETGIALLLFLVGLELSFAKIKDVGKVAMVAGVGQVVFTAAGGYVLCWLLDFSMMEALFLATGLTFSSTVVVVKLLDEKGELDSLYGRIAVGIFLVQDLVVILILTFLAGIGGVEGGEGAKIDAGAVGVGLAKAFGGMILLLTLSLLASKYLLPRPFRWAARRPEILLIWSLSWCFLLVFAAHEFGLSLEVGAFLAGMSLAQLPYNDDLRRRVHPLMNLFIAVFFVTLGVKVDASGALANWWPTVVLSVFVLIGNPLIFMGIIGKMGYGRKTAFLTSVTVAQISEFSFIFAGLGLSKGLIGAEILSITAMVGVVTIAVSSYMIIYNHGLYAWLLRLGAFRFRFLDGKPEVVDRIVHAGHGLRRHVIVVGMNALGREIVRRLVEKGEDTLAVDTDPVKLEGVPGRTLLGSVDYLTVLEKAGYAKAKLIVSALQIEETNDLLAYRAKSVGVPCAIHVVDLSVVENLLELEADYLMVSKVDGVKEQLRTLKEMGVLK
jgi:Kef-type K+ transport system membrane component KefB